MRCHTRDARDTSDLIERGWVDHTGYRIELYARGHISEMCMKGTSDSSSYFRL